MPLRLMLACLAFMFAACGSSSEQKKAEAVQQAAEQASQSATNMAKGLEDMAQGLGALGGDPTRTRKPVGPVSFRDLQNKLAGLK